MSPVVDSTTPQYARVLVASTKNGIPKLLHGLVIRESQKAISLRGCFTIAMSGGSLPSSLAGLDISFRNISIDPQWHKWHIVLADERCVPTSHEDSNMAALTTELFRHLAIPQEQIHGLDESLLKKSVGIQAEAYESKLRSVLLHSGGMLDMVLLGFGPDGHTCSLFPGHSLLQERQRWISGLDDSPKPPPKRITMTLPFLNEYTRNAVFCGAGSSKQEVLRQVFSSYAEGGRPDEDHYVRMNIGDLPCSMVRPQEDLYWVVDDEAMPIISRSCL